MLDATPVAMDEIFWCGRGPALEHSEWPTLEAVFLYLEQRGKRLGFQTECAWILADDRGREKSRNIVSVLVLKIRVQLVALFGQSTNAARAILLVDKGCQIALDIILAAIVSEQSQRFFHRIILELLQAGGDITRRCVGRLLYV